MTTTRAVVAPSKKNPAIPYATVIRASPATVTGLDPIRSDSVPDMGATNPIVMGLAPRTNPSPRGDSPMTSVR